ncbi:glycosyltransferase [Chitinispirillales bacterium ANBcel5]|uniref:glycosyltransferase n=1 Tax=Cellulosispirillum alkaliphilum TaxID=3039283 RepID=UPI002A531C3C|nr:glycosyltransferase [Chitinispirillales bacterium ANBcel5]
MESQIKVAHLITDFLPVTQNWIYNQIVHNKSCESIVLCQKTLCEEQFPFSAVYPIVKKRNLFSVPARTLHKVFEHYPTGHHQGVVRKFHPDIFHAHFLLEAWRNYSLLKKHKIPLITTMYGQDVSQLWRKCFWMKRYRKVFSLCRAFIVEGQYMKSVVAQLGCDPEKIHVVKLGIDLSRIVPKRWCDSQKTVKLLFVGLGREKKGARFAAQSFANVALKAGNVELHLVGDGPYKETVEAILRERGVSSRAVFHGMVPVERYQQILKQTDILLAPSVHAANGDTEGGAPVVVIEALASGIPVVGSFHCDIPNIVEDGVSGLLSEEKDVASLSSNLELLVKNRALRRKMGENGIRYANREHSIETQVCKITEIYRSVL